MNAERFFAYYYCVALAICAGVFLWLCGLAVQQYMSQNTPLVVCAVVPVITTCILLLVLNIPGFAYYSFMLAEKLEEDTEVEAE